MEHYQRQMTRFFKAWKRLKRREAETELGPYRKRMHGFFRACREIARQTNPASRIEKQKISVTSGKAGGLDCEPLKAVIYCGPPEGG